MSWVDRRRIPPIQRGTEELTLLGIQPPPRGMSIVEQEDRAFFRALDRAERMGPGRLFDSHLADIFGLETLTEIFLSPWRCDAARNLFADRAPFDQRWIGTIYQE